MDFTKNIEFLGNKNNVEKSFVLHISVDENSNILVESECPEICSQALFENSGNLLYCLGKGQLKNLIIESITRIKEDPTERGSSLGILKEWAQIEEEQDGLPKINPKNVFGKS